MKKFTAKITAVFILLALCAGLMAACANADAYALYREMLAAMDSVESLDMDMRLTVNSFNDVTVTFPDDLDEWSLFGIF